MILVDENGNVGAHGLNAGLNKGLKIGRFIKRNVKSASKQVSLKNAIKLAPMVAGAVATGGVGGAGLAILKKGVLKNVVKGAIKKVATKEGRNALIKKALPFVKAQATKMIANKNGAITATNEVVVSEPVGDLTPVKPIEPEAQAVEVENYQPESEPVGGLTPVKPVEETGQAFVKEATATPPPTEKKPNYMLYGGIAVGVLALGYFATKKAN